MRNILIISALLVIVQTSLSQHLQLSPSAEKTIAGYEYGCALTFRTKSQFFFGTFYQTTFKRSSENIQVSNPFYGLVASAPLMKCDRMNFHANTRIGLINKTFLVMIPGIETELKLSNAI